jgi:ribosomal protein S18 acetylase RimI-like enzyme
MPTLAGALVSRTEDATCCDELKAFSCGPGTIFPKAEEEVDAIVRVACDLNSPERKNMITRVTREEPPGSIVGITGLERGDMQFQHPRYAAPYRDAAYVAVIGVSSEYRSGTDPYRTPLGGRLGDHLLNELLLYVKQSWRGGMPWVFTAVNPDNASSREMFERFDFEFMFRMAPEGDAMFRRPKNLKVPPLPS